MKLEVRAGHATSVGSKNFDDRLAVDLVFRQLSLFVQGADGFYDLRVALLDDKTLENEKGLREIRSGLVGPGRHGGIESVGHVNDARHGFG